MMLFKAQSVRKIVENALAKDDGGRGESEMAEERPKIKAANRISGQRFPNSVADELVTNLYASSGEAKRLNPDKFKNGATGRYCTILYFVIAKCTTNVAIYIVI
ncbi:hypothetical protein WN51_02375 [Melipona quadrifasciata]|uniref:Uncharacterized protein n=1 Tax=Melipona quadrifasciata TaxID=166423 RepID=A0A0M8ZV76_9HYME|nr:hypothetical protein WN51_02375 [Melipona quadrifasciata]